LRDEAPPVRFFLCFKSILSYFGLKVQQALQFFHASNHSCGERRQPVRPHTYAVPKVLLNVGGKSIIGHILDRVIENGFDEATILYGCLGNEGM